MNELLAALAFWLADFLALATVLLAVAALAMWRLKHPAQRMAVAWASMAGLTALLLATAAPAWPRWDLRHWLAAAPADDAALIEEPIITYHEMTIPMADDALPRTNETLPAPSLLPTLAEVAIEQRIDWPAAIVIAWLACATAAVGWIVLGAVQAWRLLWTARQSPPWAQTELARIVGKRRGPRLKTSEKIGSAVALGAVRPAILLPAEHVREENLAGVKAALAHEWAHIRHGDLWLLAWQRLLLPLLAAHPLFWLLRRQIRADQELLADCAAASEKPVEYAEALLAWAKQSGPRPSAGLAALAMWESPQTVSRRIQMILDPKSPRIHTVSRVSKWLIATLLIATVMGLSTITLRNMPAVGQEDSPSESIRRDSVSNELEAAPSAVPQPKPNKSDPLGISPKFTEKVLDATELKIQQIRIGGGKAGAEKLVKAIASLRRPVSPEHKLATGVFDAGQVKQLLDQLGELAQIEAVPKITVYDGRETVFADGGNEPGQSEDDRLSGTKVERLVYRSRAVVRIQVEVRTTGELSYATKVFTTKQVARMLVTRERHEATGTVGSDGLGKPAIVSRRASILSDVPIGKTLMIADLSPPIDGDSSSLILITPTAFHKVFDPQFVVGQSIAVPGELTVPQHPSVAAPPQPADAGQPEEHRQIQAALEKLREWARSNPTVADWPKENARFQQQIADLTTQLAYLRSLAGQESSDKVTDDVFARRVYLDLLGVVPTAEDAKAFLENTDAKKREKLIDKLLADPQVADHWAETWKDLIASHKQRPEERDPAAVAEPAAETVSVFHLRHANAEDAVKLASDLFLAIRNSNARIAADSRTNSLILQGAPQHAETLAAILKVIDQPPAPSQRGESERASADRVDGHAGYDPATQRQLLEIDLQEAENELNLAKVELAEYQKIQKTSPGTLSAHDFRRKEAAMRQAELRVRRIKILLDAVAAKEKAVPRSPLSAVEEAIVPPKNLPDRIWETLGLTLEPIDEDAFEGLKSAFRGGLMVNDVRPDSPADERGLRQGDILVGLSRWETRTLDNVAYVLARDDASQAGGITFHILRDGKAMVGRLSVADADLSRRPASASPPVSETSRDKATRIRLAEIDLKEAQLKLAAASKDHARLAELAKQNTVPQSELDRAALERQHAELAVERAQIVLDGLKSPSPTLPRK